MSLWAFIKKVSGIGTEPEQQNEGPERVHSATRPVEAVSRSSQTVQNSDTIKISGRPHHRILRIGGRRVEIFADTYDEDRTNYWVAVQEGDVRYLFSPEEHRWSYHGTPLEAQQVVDEIFGLLKIFAPKPPTADFKTVYRRAGKTVYSMRGECVDQEGRVKVARGTITAGSRMLEGHVGMEAHDGGNSFSVNLDSQEITLGGRLTYMKNPIQRWLASEMAIFNIK